MSPSVICRTRQRLYRIIQEQHTKDVSTCTKQATSMVCHRRAPIQINRVCGKSLRCFTNLSYSTRQNLSRKEQQHSSIWYRHFSQTSNNNDTSVDELCRRFRQRKLDEDLWRQLFLDTQKTQSYIQQPLYERLMKEIQTEASIHPPVVGRELGPTGKYQYDISDDLEKGFRRYRRWNLYSNSNDSEEEIVFDINFHEMELGSVSLSVDESFVAYIVTPIQGENPLSQIWVRHIADKRAKMLFSGPIANVEFGPMKDGKHTIFYSTTNVLGRPDTIHACTIGMTNEINTSVPSIMYQNNDEAVIVDVQRTKGRNYVAIHATTKTSNEIRLVSSLDEEPLLVRARQEGVLYHIDVDREQEVFVLASVTEESITTSGLVEELSIFQTSIAKLPLVGEFGKKLNSNTATNDTYEQFVTNDMELFRDFIAFYESSTVDGHQRIRILDRKHDGDPITIPLPQTKACTSIHPGGNMFYDATRLCFGIESPVERTKLYEYDWLTKELISLSPEDQDNIEEEHMQGNIIHKRVLVESQDGTLVPLCMIYSNDIVRSDTQSECEGEFKTRPTILSAYGAYGQSLTMTFDPTSVPLLSRGFVLAFAHIRGGGDCGRSWYQRGRLYQKQRAVEDYIACAKALTGHLQITEPRLLTAKAFSAGGVAVGAAVNQMPSLFGNVVITNGFLDVMTATTDSTLPLTEHEWEEWGNPLVDQRARSTISHYCPVSNIKRQRYPRMLLIGTLDDENVPFWHPVSFAIKVRHNMTNREESPPLLHIETQGGHHLHGRRIHVGALENAFIVQNYEDDLKV